MTSLKHLIQKNQQWAEKIETQNPSFFKTLAQQQKPEILWIGCSDSRVPATQIVDVLPGEIFVHRNVANIVKADDVNCISAMQYAVEELKVKHIVVCGHYGCGGVKASITHNINGNLKTWLKEAHENYKDNESKFVHIKSEEDKVNLLCELNVKKQVENVSQLELIQKAWKNGQDLTIHGWIYDIKDGLIKDLNIST